MEDTQYNKEQLLIVGAGGFGRELYSWISQSNFFLNQYKCVGFIDDDNTILDGYDHDLKIIDNLKSNTFEKYSNIILAINNSKIKNEIFSTINPNLTNIIGYKHDFCAIGIQSKIHQSVILFPFVVISCNVIVEEGVFVNCGSQIGHDVTVGSNTNIMANVDIGGGCTIGKNVFIGTNATIYPRVTIPDNCIIGAGCIVFKTIKTSGTYIGNPAKKLL